MKKPVLAFAAALCLIATAQPAQDWPQQPIQIIVSFGAGGILGNGFVAHATPDGW
jgi:tripartite-type tricarboxylate transporter receptor subunit TctC